MSFKNDFREMEVAWRRMACFGMVGMLIFFSICALIIKWLFF